MLAVTCICAECGKNWMNIVGVDSPKQINCPYCGIQHGH